MRLGFPLLLGLLAAPPLAAEGCRIQTAGSSCVVVPQSQRYVSPYQVGDTLPRGTFQMLFNATYCGLPAAEDGWSYMKVERDVLRVDMSTMTVLGIVTDDLARTCR
ncbi:hypothetical protein [Flavimaricola marinus]|uniref:Uncharacterized protein n=1 Tax=Flavimaricola marinus TaxID=1819565 RepID=A0A238LIW1_9RHOB|nr:hypothetical protein [Flavimaricola marinus]SMY09657.1 hypothetical protein LOM8899_03829 [Flavimaricola marinus]